MSVHNANALAINFPHAANTEPSRIYSRQPKPNTPTSTQPTRRARFALFSPSLRLEPSRTFHSIRSRGGEPSPWLPPPPRSPPPPPSGCCVSSGSSSFQPRIFTDTLKLYTERTHRGGLIFEAAREGNIPIMKTMAELCRIEGKSLEVVEEIKDSPNGTSLGALHVAALNGKLEMCEFLIDELNLDVNAAAQHGLSPLICAIYGTAPKRIVELLLDRGAKPDIPTTEGFTVLHVLATKQDPFGIADILLSRGANVDSMSSEGTPLHFAAHCGNLEMMEVLLKYGANPNRVVQSSYAPLTLALFASSFKCVELVIQGGADVNAARPVTPLIIAARYGLSDCIECLLEARADPNIPDEIGRMPVEIAAIHGRKECVDILFPVTSPVAKFADWSIDGIMQHVKSGSSEDHLHTIVQAAFKAQGDAAFERKDYAQASALYTRIEHQQSIIMQNISSETVLDDLPESVVISDILVRLPAEDILRCRVVRKSWRHATSTHDFLLAHHRRQPSLPVIEHIKRGGQVLDRHLFVYFDASPGTASRKLSQKTILWYPDPCLYKDNLVIHGSCDGLLVVSVTEGYFDICNPITRQRVPLALTCDHDDGLPVTGIRIAGFYQHLASEEYRVLYSICTRNEDTSKVDFHVLAVGCSQSRRITEPPLQQGFLDGLTCSKNAPVLNHGNLHWLLPRYYGSDDFSNIIVFDTNAETFRWMRSPPCKYSWSWMSLLELDGALAMCSSHDGIVIAINVMHDYKAEVWAPTYKINLSALEASPQLYLPARLHKIGTFNERELLIELPGCVLHCDLDGKFLGMMEWDENKGTRMHITSFRFQENIVPLPFFGMREYYGDYFMPEDEDYYEMKYSIW